MTVAASAVAADMQSNSGSAAREAAAAAFRKALVSSASWRMERTLPGSDRTFVSSGTVDCRVGGSGIEWRTMEPFRSLVAMRKDSIVFEDEDGRREKTAAETPCYADIRKVADAFASGDTDAIEAMFDEESAMLPGGRWRIVLKPRVPAMRTLVKSVEMTGRELPDTVVMMGGNGSASSISFKAAKNGDAR